MVKIQSRVRGAAIGVGVTVAVLAGLTILFRQTNAGKYVTDSLRGFGQNVGLGITAPFTGIVEGVTTGAGALGEAAKAASEGFQKSVSATLGGGFNVFTDFGKIFNPGSEQQPAVQQTQPAPTQNPRPNTENKRQPAPQSTTSRSLLTTYLTPTASQARITTSKRVASKQEKGSQYGGFASAQAQEAAYQKAIEDSKRKYAQYYQAPAPKTGVK